MSDISNLPRDTLESWALRMKQSLGWIGDTLHPGYGGCDGFADGHCTECERAIGSMRAEIEQLRKENIELRNSINRLAVAVETTKNTQQMPQWKNATCRGSYALGTACGRCERCEWERGQTKESGAEQTRWKPRWDDDGPGDGCELQGWKDGP